MPYTEEEKRDDQRLHEYRSQVAEALIALDGGRDLKVCGNQHTGGGCFALEIILPNGDQMYAMLDAREGDAWSGFDWTDSDGDLIATLSLQTRPFFSGRVNPSYYPGHEASPAEQAEAILRLVDKIIPRTSGEVFVSILDYANGNRDVEILAGRPTFGDDLRDSVDAGDLAAFDIRVGNINGGDSLTVEEGGR